MTDYRVFPLVITTVQTTENLPYSIRGQATPGYYGCDAVENNTGGMATVAILLLEENQAAGDHWLFESSDRIING